MTNTGLAELSDTLLITAIGAYALAMIGYTVEYTFGVRGAVASRARALVPKQRALAAVGSSASTEAEPPDPLEDKPGVETSERGHKAARFGICALIATIIGASAQAACLVTRGLSTERVPWGNMYEFISAVCLAGVLAWLALAFTKPVRHLGMFVLLPVVLLLGLAGTVLYAEAAPLMPALNSFWLKIHVSTAALASGIFLVGFVTATLYLVRQRYEARIAQWTLEDANTALEPAASDSEPQNDEEQPNRELRFPLTLGPRLPHSENLERLTFRIHALAFPIWTFAIVAGAIWAEAAWTRYWGWDPKETWAFISWVVYAAYLHARATNGWRGPKAIAIALAGWASMMVNLFVINLVTSGLHSYAGVS